MRTLSLLVVLSLSLVVRFNLADGFTFPSILDDARQALMKFSKTSSKSSGGSVSVDYISPSTLSKTKLAFFILLSTYYIRFLSIGALPRFDLNFCAQFSV